MEVKQESERGREMNIMLKKETKWEVKKGRGREGVMKKQMKKSQRKKTEKIEKGNKKAIYLLGPLPRLLFIG